MPARPPLPTQFACAFLLLAALLCATAAASPLRSGTERSGTENPGTWCGGELWRLMTLSDVDRAAVDLHGAPTTIAEIAALTSPKRIVATRTTAFQRSVWRLHAVVDRYRIASNGEIVLILFSIDTGQYMDAYLPNPTCLGERARDRSGMIAARKQFTSHCPTVTAVWQLLGTTVDVAGVGFWNPSKRTRGALANGAELRPLTNLRIVSCCGVG
jgi:hypothetical protein